MLKIKVPNPVTKRAISIAVLLPYLSPTCPRIRAPIGREMHAIPKATKLSIIRLPLSCLGKKLSPIGPAKYAYDEKSNLCTHKEGRREGMYKHEWNDTEEFLYFEQIVCRNKAYVSIAIPVSATANVNQLGGFRDADADTTDDLDTEVSSLVLATSGCLSVDSCSSWFIVEKIRHPNYFVKEKSGWNVDVLCNNHHKMWQKLVSNIFHDILLSLFFMIKDDKNKNCHLIII